MRGEKADVNEWQRDVHVLFSHPYPSKGGYGIVLLRCVAITMVLIKSKLEIGRGACVLIGVMAHNCTSAIVVIHQDPEAFESRVSSHPH